MKHIVMFSGGAGSWATAKRVAEQYGTDDLLLLFSDTLIEDPDLYRFLDDAHADVGGELIKLVEGRDPWQIFFDVRFLGNSRIDPCSRILKRDLIRKWVEDRYTPEDVVIYLGIDWTEEHRSVAIQNRWKPYKTEFPLCIPPLRTKKDFIEDMEGLGIKLPLLYCLGFQHNNCGGFCIKAGQAQFALLLKTLPERYQYHEQKEQELREFLGKDVTILKRQEAGKIIYMTLKEFRERLETGEQYDLFEWGGCACFA